MRTRANVDGVEGVVSSASVALVVAGDGQRPELREGPGGDAEQVTLSFMASNGWLFLWEFSTARCQLPPRLVKTPVVSVWRAIRLSSRPIPGIRPGRAG